MKTLVVATAGHVDHGKSTLVRALTGTDPDRWEEEKKRGLTIDLGFAWATWGSTTVAFVDVPGHRRFLGNMLAGLGPAPAVVLIVAADEGWSAQTSEHLAAILGLRIPRGLVVVTKGDLAHPGAVSDEVQQRVRGTSWEGVPILPVSAVSGAGMEELRAALLSLGEAEPVLSGPDRVRLWVDRSFTVAGAGTVVTGTLSSGTVRRGDTLVVASPELNEWVPVVVRGLRVLGGPATEAVGPTRVALNLRGVDVHQVPRGSAVLTPEAWQPSHEIDVVVDAAADELPRRVSLHLGTQAVGARVRPLQGRAARCTLPTPLPLTSGDVVLLRDPGQESAVWGAVVVDPDPPALRRRGDAARWAHDILGATVPLSLLRDVARRGWLLRATAQRLGHVTSTIPQPDVGLPDDGVVLVGEYLTTMGLLRGCNDSLTRLLEHRAREHPAQPTMPVPEVANKLLLPHTDAFTAVVTVRPAHAAPLEVQLGRVGLAGVQPELGASEAGIAWIEARLRDHPFAAPEAEHLEEHQVSRTDLAIAVAAKRLLVLDGVVLAPSSPALAMRRLAALEQPFTLSEARKSLETTRRVAVPLLEYLDSRGWTKRVDSTRRVVVR